MAQWILVGGVVSLAYGMGSLCGYAKAIHRVLLEIRAQGGMQEGRR